CVSTKVRSSQIEGLIQEAKLRGSQAAVEVISEKRVRLEEEVAAIRSEVKSLALKSMAFRLEHMSKAPGLIGEVTEELVQKGLLSEVDVHFICRAAEIHDYPSIEKALQQLRTMGINGGYDKGSFLFTFDDTLFGKMIVFLREADRLFMLSYEGLAKDLIETKEAVTHENIKKKLESNQKSHKKEYLLYVDANRDDGKFIEHSLYRTHTGYSLYVEYAQECGKKIDELFSIENSLVKVVKAIEQKKDPSRPLPGQPMLTIEEVRQEVKKYDLNKLDIIKPDSVEVRQAVEYLNSIGEAEMAQYLEYLVKAELIRAGSLEGFLATLYTDEQSTEYILLSNFYPKYNTAFQKAASLIHEIGAILQFNFSHIENTAREESFQVSSSSVSTNPVFILSEKKAFALDHADGEVGREIKNANIARFISGLSNILNKGILPVVVADMDGTLTLARDKCSDEMAEMIVDILRAGGKFVICTSSDKKAAYDQVVSQIEEKISGEKRLLANLYIFVNLGTEAYKYSSKLDQFILLYKLDLKKELGEENVNKINKLILEVVNKYNLKSIRGDFIEDRDSQITFFVIGKDATKEEKLIYYNREQSGEACNRKELALYLNQKFKIEGISILAQPGGKSSIDINLKDVNKGYAIERIAKECGISKLAIIYFGDEFKLGGNDVQAAKEVELTVNVGSPEISEELLDKIIITSKKSGPEGVLQYLDKVREALSLVDLKEQILYNRQKLAGASTERNDPARPLPVQAIFSKEEVSAEVYRHDLSKFDIIVADSSELTQALAYLCSTNETAMAEYLEYLAKAGLIRAGPLAGFVATAYTDAQGTEYILLSNLYLEHNTILQRFASLVHEIGATTKFNRSH
ncbi:MAG: HAD-IIB family hydrolase, partial [Candidatus Omnitrophota bacterium]|nr:HAD-IIB family hydrolase [Candidatus Omnitrophota bacterium]